MLLKKYISITIIVLYLSMMYFSCERNGILLPPSDRSVKEENTLNNSSDENSSKQNIEYTLKVNPGELHNQILDEMNHGHVFEKKAKLSKQKFIDMIILSSNAVFNRNNVDYTVTHEDIGRILQCFDNWKNMNVFDAYKPIHERSIGDVFRLMDYLSNQQQCYNTEEIEKVRSVFQQLEAIGIENCNSSILNQLIDDYISDDVNSESYVSLKILQHSYNFWSDLEIDITEQRTVYSVPDENDIPIYKIDLWSINVLLWDAVGALLCWPLGPVSVICAVIASTAYIVATTK